MHEVELTNVAASRARAFSPRVQSALGAFFSDELEPYVDSHDPVQLSGLDGQYWVVPAGQVQRGLAAVTTRDDDGGLIVIALVDGQPQTGQQGMAGPSDLVLGADVLRLADAGHK